jgi:hypothetical protein
MASPNVYRRSAEPVRLVAPVLSIADARPRLRGAAMRAPRQRPRSHSAQRPPAVLPAQRVMRDFIVAVAVATLWLALMEALQALQG